jgi:proteasome lid subunit RPN8/RPN11
MKFLLNTKTREKKYRRVIGNLSFQLDQHFQELIYQVACQSNDPEAVQVITNITLQYSEIIAGLQGLLQQSTMAHPIQLQEILREHSSDLIRMLGDQSDDLYFARRSLLEGLRLISLADERLSKMDHIKIHQEVVQIDVPSDLLLQCFQTLFPAERMAVVSGRRTSAGVITLGTLFDVTGVATSGHVNANPDALARALIAMDRSGTFLAGWFHSHPGSGAINTRPSITDLNQYADWIKDFSDTLLGVIFVKDGCLRFWGTDNRPIKVCIQGFGFEKEAKDERSYKIKY